MSNPSEVPSARVLSLKLGEGETPLVSSVNGQIQAGAPVFENPAAIAVSPQFTNISNISPISEGSATIVKSYTANLERALGPDAWQVQYLKDGLTFTDILKDAKMPTNMGDLQLKGLSTDEMATIKDALANPNQVAEVPDTTARLYGTGSVQSATWRGLQATA